MAAHLPRLLQAGGATLAAAVALGALVGPAQVGGRLLEFGLLRRVHPLLSARLAALMHPLGAGLLALPARRLAALFALLHGAGNGILTIAKGTLPLVLFGPQGYGHRQGLLMVPARVAQALSPWLFGILLDRCGAGALWFSAALGLAASCRAAPAQARGRPAPRRRRPTPAAPRRAEPTRRAGRTSAPRRCCSSACRSAPGRRRTRGPGGRRSGRSGTRCAGHHLHVGLGADGAGQRGIEARPAGAALELGLGAEEGQVAAGAVERPLRFSALSGLEPGRSVPSWRSTW